MKRPPTGSIHHMCRKLLSRAYSKVARSWGAKRGVGRWSCAMRWHWPPSSTHALSYSTNVALFLHFQNLTTIEHFSIFKHLVALLRSPELSSASIKPGTTPHQMANSPTGNMLQRCSQCSTVMGSPSPLLGSSTDRSSVNTWYVFFFIS